MADTNERIRGGCNFTNRAGKQYTVVRETVRSATSEESSQETAIVHYDYTLMSEDGSSVTVSGHDLLDADTWVYVP